MIASIGRLLKSFFLGFLALFKRAMCFLNRKRRNSGAILPTHVQSADINIPTQVLSNSFQYPPSIADPGVPAPSADLPAQPPAACEVEDDEPFTEWDNWDKPAQVQQDGGQKQQQFSVTAVSKPPPAEPEPEPDYFSDLGLAPTIKKQKKVLVKPATNSSHIQAERSSRLSFTPDLAVPLSAELEEWDDSTGGGWEDEDVTQEAEQALRQSRKDERERRLAEHQRRNQEREHRKLSKDGSRLATRLS